jgi:hypothetical protein
MRELRGFGVRINLLSLPWCAFGESSLGLYHLAVIFLYLRDFFFSAPSYWVFSFVFSRVILFGHYVVIFRPNCIFRATFI